MKWLIIPLLLLSSITHASDYVGYIKDTNYFYAKGVLYQIAGDKAYKVENIDGELLTTNEWIPTKRNGYTDEYVREIKQIQREKQHVAKHANEFIKNNRGY